MEDLVTHPFWKGKKVLITGHTGFKGSWLSLWLQNKGASVIGYSLLPPTKPSFFELGRIFEGMISITGDVRDLNHLKEVIKKHQPEIVFHMAAQPLVRYSYTNPLETYSTNVMGTVNLLEVVRQTDFVRAVLIITSDKCYENTGKSSGYQEMDPMGGHDPYSSSKGCAELITSAYRNSFFSGEVCQTHRVSLASARAGNVIGGGDWALDRLVPDIMQSVIQNQRVIIRNPKAIRPWQHVLEPLAGYVRLVERLWDHDSVYACGWNFGPGDEDCKPVDWIVNELTHRWPTQIEWVLDSGENPHEAVYLKLDCTKSKNKLGWKPRLNLSDAIEWIVEWYQEYLKGNSVRKISECQISRYESME